MVIIYIILLWVIEVNSLRTWSILGGGVGKDLISVRRDLFIFTSYLLHF